MQIDFLGIQAFLAVVECRSFSQAATRLHLSQTAVSHRMRKLEESLGTPLVVRTSRGIALTESGEALLPMARSAVQQLQTSCEAIRRDGRQAPRWVAFGCIPTLASVVVPLLRERHDALGEVQLRLFDATPGEIVELVQGRAAAFGLTVAQEPLPGVVLEPLGDEPFVLACPADHPMARQTSVGWDELADHPLIRISLPSGNSLTIDSALGSRRTQLRWRYEAQRTAMALDMVGGGLGLTVVPQLCLGDRPDLVGVPLVAPAVARTLVLVRRDDEPLEGPQRQLADALTQRIRQRLAHEPGASRPPNNSFAPGPVSS